jgi:hypothetical protein
MPSTDRIEGSWKQQVGAAKIASSRSAKDGVLNQDHRQSQSRRGLGRIVLTCDDVDGHI